MSTAPVLDRPAGDRPAARPADRSGVAGLVDLTPASRDRYVDLLRALSILVVVLWHWTFSINQWTAEGSLTMPNPIGDVPGAWAATWLLQVMPVFFFVGGYSNLAGFEGIQRDGGGWAAFARKRLSRLLRPVGVFAGVWLFADVVVRFLAPGTPSVLSWGMVVFVPLWFLGVYTAVVLLAPFTARAHQRSAGATTGLLIAGIAACEVARFGFGIEEAGLLTSVFVWVFVHQLGYWWRDGSLTSGGRGRVWALTAVGFGGLVALTNIGVYPRSMVSVTGEGSNMFPTTACIAALAVFQLGVALAVRPAANRWLQRRGPWTATVSVNAVAMTIFTWHMTALALAIFAYQIAGFTLITAPTATWWLHRPLWLLLPGIVLAGFVRLFARFELPAAVTGRGR